MVLVSIELVQRETPLIKNVLDNEGRAAEMTGSALSMVLQSHFMLVTDGTVRFHFRLMDGYLITLS